MKMKNMNIKKKKFNKEFKDEIEEDPLEEIIYEDEDDLEIRGPLASLLDNEEDILGEEQDSLEEEEDEEEVKEVVVDLVKIKKASKEKYYVDPKQFDEEIVKYYDSGHMSDELALMVSKIANKLSYAPNFINYTYREEMVGDGIIRMFKALTSKKYDRVKGTNPFSYFTRIAFNAFRNRIKREKHMRETHEKYQREFMIMSDGYNNLLKNNQIRIMKERERKFHE